MLYFFNKRNIIRFRVIHSDVKKVNIYIYPKKINIIIVPSKINNNKIFSNIRQNLQIITKKIDQIGIKKNCMRRICKYRIIYSHQEQVKFDRGIFTIYTSRPCNKKHNYQLVSNWVTSKLFMILRLKYDRSHDFFLSDIKITKIINSCEKFILNPSFILYSPIMLDYLIHYIICSFYYNAKSKSFYSLLNGNISNTIKKHFCI